MRKREKYILTEYGYDEGRIYELTIEEYNLIEDILDYLNVTQYSFINIENCDVYKREDEE